MYLQGVDGVKIKKNNTNTYIGSPECGYLIKY